MKFEDITGKSADQLNQMVIERRKELFNLRFQRATGELSNTSRFRAVRKEIAQIKTYMTELKQGTAKPAKTAAAKPAKKAPAAKKTTKAKKSA